eukprot:1162129-Pelagomonas_calceolata.AAC.8
MAPSAPCNLFKQTCLASCIGVAPSAPCSPSQRSRSRYGTKYALQPIPEEWVQAWKQASQSPTDCAAAEPQAEGPRWASMNQCTSARDETSRHACAQAEGPRCGSFPVAHVLVIKHPRHACARAAGQDVMGCSTLAMLPRMCRPVFGAFVVLSIDGNGRGKPLNNLSSYTSRLQCCVPVYFLASPTPIAAPLTECAFGRLAVSSSSFVLLSLVYSCQQQELIRSHFLPICASLFCRLHLPEPNPFVPTDLSLKTEEASAFVASGIVGPQLIEEQPGVLNLWH